MTKRLLELFSGTHSVGRVAEEMGYEVTSLDRDLPAKSKIYDYTSKNHIMEDIMTWNYKVYKPGHFYVITASPVCLFWSSLRSCSFGREIKSHPGEIFSKELAEKDIEKFGKPMVDKCREILEYFKPKYWWIENPKTGRMKEYITDLPYFDIDYCKYSDWGYKKTTRFWTNIEGFNAKTCKNNCDNLDESGKKHKGSLGNCSLFQKQDGTIIEVNTKQDRKKANEANLTKIKRTVHQTTKYERYRIPEKLIRELLELCE